MAEIKIISQPFQTLGMESFWGLFLRQKPFELDFRLFGDLYHNVIIEFIDNNHFVELSC